MDSPSFSLEGKLTSGERRNQLVRNFFHLSGNFGRRIRRSAANWPHRASKTAYFLGKRPQPCG
jgi:hypothetical protein